MPHGNGLMLERSPRNARRALRVARSRERKDFVEARPEARASARPFPAPADAPQNKTPPDHSGGNGPQGGGEEKVQNADMAQNRAQVDEARAALTFAEQQAGRYATMAVPSRRPNNRRSLG